MLRHGATAWNLARRIQGRLDLPLVEAGRRRVRRWHLPAPWREAPCLTSPLARARETAALLGFADARPEPRLIEMDWGGFTGWRLADLRTLMGERMAALEALGLDFRPPRGESPREVAARLGDLLRALAEDGGDRLLITHKGVRRAALVLACGWRMTGRPPLRLADDAGLLLELDAEGRPGAARSLPLLAEGS